MKRSEREIKDRKEIEAIIERADVCRLGLSDDNMPYIIPMNFGYKDNRLYFHCAKKGKKIDIIKRNNSTCFEMDRKLRRKTRGNEYYHSALWG